MPLTKGSKRKKNLGSYAEKGRKRPRQNEVQQPELQSEIPPSPVLRVEPIPIESDESPSETDEEDADVEVLFGDAVAVAEFSAHLQQKLSAHLAKQAEKTRPTRYNKIMSTKRTTIQSRNKAIKEKTDKLRSSGFPDIRSVFARQAQAPERDDGMSDDEIQISNGLPNTVALMEADAAIAWTGDSEMAMSPVDTAAASPSHSPSPSAVHMHEELTKSTSPIAGSESGGVLVDSVDGLEQLDILLERVQRTESAQSPATISDDESSPESDGGAIPDTGDVMVGASLPGQLDHSQPIPTLPAPVKASRAPAAKMSPQIESAIRTLAALVRKKDMHLVLRGRIMAMLAMLRFYASPVLAKSWTAASELAALGAGKGKALARQLRQWTTAYLADSTHLPTLGCYNPRHALVEDEAFAQEVKLHLQSVGKFFTAMDIVRYMGIDETRARVGLAKPISLSTAHRWLKALDYRYGKEAKGMYVDGHERENVVEYRQGEFLRRWGEMEKNMVLMDKDGEITHAPPIPLRRIILFTHNESTFYANDQCKVRWIHSSESPKPIRKGDGPSLMVSDFCSPDYGWLRSSDGSREARVFFRAGKNRDGYFDSTNVLNQIAKAIDIFEERFPEAIGLFAFDNATTHQARAPDALSARKMPKTTRDWLPASGVRMRDGILPNGQPQPFYYPDNHLNPNLAGKFKGMKVLLEERGLWPRTFLRFECEGFKCPEGRTDCCCRCLLYCQPDFANQKGILQEYVEKRGHFFIFYPKFHCELNFIEMCWGKSKFIYRMKAPPKESEMEQHVRAALEAVTIEQMRRYANRSARFLDAYRHGLSGSQAVWANRKYHGHRTLPSSLVDEIKASTHII